MIRILHEWFERIIKVRSMFESKCWNESDVSYDETALGTDRSLTNEH